MLEKINELVSMDESFRCVVFVFEVCAAEISVLPEGQHLLMSLEKVGPGKPVAQPLGQQRIHREASRRPGDL